MFSKLPNIHEVGDLGYDYGCTCHVHMIHMYLQVTSKEAYSHLESVQFGLGLFQHLTWL